MSWKLKRTHEHEHTSMQEREEAFRRGFQDNTCGRAREKANPYHDATTEKLVACRVGQIRKGPCGEPPDS